MIIKRASLYVLAAQILAFSGIAVQSNSSERSAFLLTSGFLVNQPMLNSSL